MSVLTITEKLTCNAVFLKYFLAIQIEVNFFVEVFGVLEVV